MKPESAQAATPVVAQDRAPDPWPAILADLADAIDHKAAPVIRTRGPHGQYRSLDADQDGAQ